MDTVPICSSSLLPHTSSLRVVNHPAIFKVALFTSLLKPLDHLSGYIFSVLFVIPEDMHIAEHTNKNFIKEVAKGVCVRDS